VLVSAVTGEGLGDLQAAIESRVVAGRVSFALSLDPADGASASWLHRHTEVLAKSLDDEGRLAMTVRADPAKAALIRRRFAREIAG
jgi:GTP-binding protein HflX